MKNKRQSEATHKERFHPGGTYTSEDVHRVLFPEKKPTPKTLAELKEGIRQYMKEKYVRPDKS